LVNIDDEYYYVDPTYLDNISLDINNDGVIDSSQSIISSGQGEVLTWYSAVPFEYSDKDHTSNNMPLHLEITSIEGNKGKDKYSSDSLYKIIVNENEYIVTLAVVVGILSVLGLIKKCNTKNRKNKKYK